VIAMDLKVLRLPWEAQQEYRSRVMPHIFDMWGIGGAVGKAGVLVLVDASSR
jgi:hypothetical protein